MRGEDEVRFGARFWGCLGEMRGDLVELHLRRLTTGLYHAMVNPGRNS